MGFGACCRDWPHAALFSTQTSLAQTSDSKLRRSEQILNLLRVPMRLEKFLLMGILVCFDLLLHNFTFLPVRCISGIWTIFLAGLNSK